MHARLLGIAVGTLVAIGTASSLAAQAPEGATAKCKDDTYSTSTSHRGACKGHGGVSDWLVKTETKTKTTSKKEKAAAASETAAPAATAAKTAPSGAAPGDATAQCKDGSYSRAHHHRGACSRHGGVQQWLKEVPE